MPLLRQCHCITPTPLCHPIQLALPSMRLIFGMLLTVHTPTNFTYRLTYKWSYKSYYQHTLCGVWSWLCFQLLSSKHASSKLQLLSLCLLGMWRSSHSNSTTFELRMFSVDSKFVEFFHVPVVEFEPQVYTIGTTCLHPPATGTTNWTNAHCLIVWKDQKWY